MAPRHRIYGQIFLVLLICMLVKDAFSANEETNPGVSGGRWGPWTEWSSCSKTCGQGVVYRKRQCHALSNKISAVRTDAKSLCRGPEKQYKVCKNTCAGQKSDYRSVECQKYNGKFYGGRRYYWEAFINPYNRCELACKARGHRYYARFKDSVVDGTYCKVDKEAICIQGKCLDIGCDGIAGTKTKIDQCGVCGGDGTSCQVISGIFTRTHLAKFGYNTITKIPSGACNINITELAKSRNYLALKAEGGQYILNGNRHLHPTGNYEGLGTVFEYHRRRDNTCPGECIQAMGPTNQTLEVQVLYYHRNPGIMYHFTVPKTMMSKVVSDMMTASKSDKSSFENGGHHHQNRNHNQRIRNHGHRRRQYPKNSQNKELTTSVPDSSKLERPVEQQSDIYVSRHRNRHQPHIIPAPRRQHSERTNIQRGQYSQRRNIQHGQSPQYIPAYDRNHQLTLANSPRIIPRTYVNKDHSTVRNTQRQSVRGAYANRYSNGQHGLNGQSSSNSYYNRNGHHRNTNWNGQSTLNSNLLIHTNSDSLVPNNGYQSTNNVHQNVDGGRVADDFGQYSWKIAGFSECSVSCGGGSQKTQIVCMKGNSQVVVTEDNCDPINIPRSQTVACNSQLCPPSWETADWSDCSVSCGKGIQTRSVECKQRISPTLTHSVSASLCVGQNRPAVTRMCQLKPCADWKIGVWGKCSTDCGHGQRTREVTCQSADGKTISDSQCSGHKPSREDICDMGSCAKGWYHTRWTQECSTECGRGHYTRKVYCSADDGSSLPERKCSGDKKPRTRKTCKDNVPCGGKWFTGPWSKCNSTCGVSVKKRDVVCIKKLQRNLHTIVGEENCLGDDKPEEVEDCGDLPQCQPEWYSTEWTQCSVSCGTGSKTREVKCLDADLRPSLRCSASDRPAERHSCNKQHCNRTYKPQNQLQKDSTGDSNCKDVNSSWCLLVKQSRLCRYKVYYLQCCVSCKDYKL